MKQTVLILLALIIGFVAGMQSDNLCKPLNDLAMPQDTASSIKPAPSTEGVSGQLFREQDCTNPQSTDQQLWCEARQNFNEHSEQASGNNDSESWNKYLTGYKDGAYDAHHARIRKISGTEAGKDQYDLGYSQGYNSATESMGLAEYDCATEAMQSEYQSRWCEAAELFTDSNAGRRAGDNPVLRARFIDGYLSGGRVALTIPTSVNELMADAAEQALEAKLPLILGEQDNTLPDAARAFQEGLEMGYEGMVNNVQDIMAQVMQEFMFNPKNK